MKYLEVRGNGDVVTAVGEKEIWESLKKVPKLDFFIQPTSATVTTGLSQLVEKEIIKPTDSAVVILTGFGLKAADKI